MKACVRLTFKLNVMFKFSVPFTRYFKSEIINIVYGNTFKFVREIMSLYEPFDVFRINGLKSTRLWLRLSARNRRTEIVAVVSFVLHIHIIKQMDTDALHRLF